MSKNLSPLVFLGIASSSWNSGWYDINCSVGNVWHVHQQCMVDACILSWWKHSAYNVENNKKKEIWIHNLRLQKAPKIVLIEQSDIAIVIVKINKSIFRLPLIFILIIFKSNLSNLEFAFKLQDEECQDNLKFVAKIWIKSQDDLSTNRKRLLKSWICTHDFW